MIVKPFFLRKTISLNNSFIKLSSLLEISNDEKNMMCLGNVFFFFFFRRKCTSAYRPNLFSSPTPESEQRDWLFFPSFHRWENWGSKRLNDLAKVILWDGARARNSTPIPLSSLMWFHSLAHYDCKNALYLSLQNPWNAILLWY